MQFDPKFLKGLFQKRYKRFLADVLTEDGELLTVHCPNTGSMRNCLAPNAPCWYSVSDNPKRKYPNTLEIVTTPDGYLAGINTSRTNHLVAEAIKLGQVEELRHYQTVKAEQKSPIDNSRLDFFLTGHPDDPRNCFVEVKNVTLMEAPGAGYFPDAVSDRGAKHLQVLTELLNHGYRSVLFFCVQHTGIETVAPADFIDEKYGRLLRQAHLAGVEVLAYRYRINAGEIAIDKALPIVL